MILFLSSLFGVISGLLWFGADEKQRCVSKETISLDIEISHPFFIIKCEKYIEEKTNKYYNGYKLEWN